MRIVAYERVSTARQGRSGLGLDAQRRAIDDFAAFRSADVIAHFTEVESGRSPDRPELAKALHLAKVTGATLVIAKLDRLSRNAAFLLTLRDSGVAFLTADMASTPRSWSRSSTFRSHCGKRTQNIAARRMISGLFLKHLKGLGLVRAKRQSAPSPPSSQPLLTMPAG